MDQNQPPVYNLPPPRTGSRMDEFPVPGPRSYELHPLDPDYRPYRPPQAQYQQPRPPQQQKPPPPQQQKQSSGILKGCLAALCCCCMLDACF